MRLLSYLTPGISARVFEALADVVGAELRLQTDVSGPTTADDPFRRGEIDLGWLCSTSYVDLTMDPDDPSVRLIGVGWVPDDPDSAGQPVYFGDLVVRRDSDIASFEQLEGRVIGCNDPVSLSGYQALLIELRDRGHDPATWAQLRFTGGHQHSMDQVIDGRIDAAMVDSVVRLGRARTDVDVADLRVIKRIGPWPTQPIVARVSLSADATDEVRARLLASTSDAGLMTVLDHAAIANLVPIDERAFERLRGAMIEHGFA